MLDIPFRRFCFGRFGRAAALVFVAAFGLVVALVVVLVLGFAAALGFPAASGVPLLILPAAPLAKVLDLYQRDVAISRPLAA